MNFNYQHQLNVLTHLEDYSDKQLKILNKMVDHGIEQGALGRRPNGWLETVLYLGYGSTLIDNRDRVVGFSVVRPVGVDHKGALIAYGECSLWRNQDYWDDVRCVLAQATEVLGAKYLWGAFFGSNRIANEFFSIDKGFERMQPWTAPHCIKRELKNYQNIEYACLTI